MAGLTVKPTCASARVLTECVRGASGLSEALRLHSYVLAWCAGQTLALQEPFETSGGTSGSISGVLVCGR